MRTVRIFSLLVLIAGAAKANDCHTCGEVYVLPAAPVVRHCPIEQIHLCDGQCVEACVRAQGRAGIVISIDGTDVFVERERICDSAYSRRDCGCSAFGATTIVRNSAAASDSKVFYDGRYVTQEEKSADEARLKAESDELLRNSDTKVIDAQRAKGLVPYFGRWVTPAEREQLRAEVLEKQSAARSNPDAAHAPLPSATPPATPAAEKPAEPADTKAKIKTEWVNTYTREDGVTVPGHYRVVKEKE